MQLPLGMLTVLRISRRSERMMEEQALQGLESPFRPRDQDEPGIYVVIARTHAAARFRSEDPTLEVSDFPTQLGPVKMRFGTRYDSEEFETPVPRELFAEVTGEAASPGEALSRFTDFAGLICPLIALSTNAYVGTLEPHLAFDTTPGRQHRGFLQVLLPDEQGLPTQGRRIDADATVSLLSALFSHSESARLHRAALQYSLALERWRRGDAAFAVAHLFMGHEALVHVAVKSECERANLAVDELFDSWGGPEEFRNRGHWVEA